MYNVLSALQLLYEVAEAVLDIAQNKISQLAHTVSYYMNMKCCAICFA